MKITDNVSEIEITVGHMPNHIIFRRPNDYSKPDFNGLQLSFIQWQELRDKTDKMIKIVENNEKT